MLNVISENGSTEILFKRWLLDKKHAMEIAGSESITLTEFARRLGVGQASMSTWIHGTRKPSYEAVLDLAGRTGDYSVLSIFGYSAPWMNVIPQPLWEAFNQASLEFRKRCEEMGVTDLSSPEAMEIAKQAFERFGFTVNLKSG